MTGENTNDSQINPTGQSLLNAQLRSSVSSLSVFKPLAHSAQFLLTSQSVINTSFAKETYRQTVPRLLLGTIM